MITPAQCFDARALLKWSRDRLAPKCGANSNALRLFELGRRDFSPEIKAALRAALESEGIEFIPENGSGAGVRLRKGVVS